MAIDDREFEEENEGDMQEHTYDPPTLEDVDEEEEFDQLAMITHPHQVQPDLGVVRCAIAHPVPTDDWRRTAILTTNILINDKPCKILIDSGSCVNAISRNTINRTGLKPVQHPKPYKVSWIDTTLLSITEQCQVSLKMVGYQDNIWCM